MKKSIGIRFEGGIGDVLLFNRFIPAIKEVHPDSDIFAYLDTDGNPTQETLLRYLYSPFYKEIYTIPNKKYKQLKIKSAWGEESGLGFIENVPDEWMEKIKSHHIWYNGHIDSLEWLNYDFDWKKYFREIPKPFINPPNKYGKYICCHLFSEFNVDNHLEPWWLEQVINTIASEFEEYSIYIISTPDTNHIYSGIIKCNNIKLFNGSVTEVSDLIFNTEFMLSVDSGWRIVSFGCQIPTLVINRFCRQVGSAPPFRNIRWDIYPETNIPHYYPAKKISKMVRNMLTHPVYRLYPYLDNWETELIRRKYTISENSVL